MSNTDYTRSLEIFKEISRIPRKSGHLEKITAYIQNWADQQGFSHNRDSAGNIAIYVPATSGMEKAPVVVLQGHMDMVCEKSPGSKHNFLTDTLDLYEEKGWLKARDTTLGADNGIALALAFDLATDPEIVHPPLEILITADEEIGLIGAGNLGPGLISGRLLINLDSEEEGVFTVGCAGGQNTDLLLPVSRQKDNDDLTILQISVSGLKGGHSGMDINSHRANANRILSRILISLADTMAFSLVSCSGGSAHNAIPRDSFAEIAISQEAMGEVKRTLNELKEKISAELQVSEPEFHLDLKELSHKSFNALTTESTLKVLRFMASIPHGVQYMSDIIPGQVETSTNFATIETSETHIRLLTNQRSSRMSRLDAVSRSISALGEVCGAEISHSQRYDAWEPRAKSPLVDLCVETYKTLFKKNPVVESTHAGLECGLISSQIDGLDMISLGPDIRNPHSPDERLFIESVGMVRLFVKKIFSCINSLL